MIFDTYLNYICYLIIFTLLSWDNIYYIVIDKGNDVFAYFKVKKYKKCSSHNSYKCICKKELTHQNIESIVKNYIQFYKFCSDIFTVSNGKIEFINIKSKYNSISDD